MFWLNFDCLVLIDAHESVRVYVIVLGADGHWDREATVKLGLNFQVLVSFMMALIRYLLMSNYLVDSTQHFVKTLEVARYSALGSTNYLDLD